MGVSSEGKCSTLLAEGEGRRGVPSEGERVGVTGRRNEAAAAMVLVSLRARQWRWFCW